MIRVIEHGFKYRMEACCANCGCRFTYEWEDVLKNSNYGYTANNIYYPSYPFYYLLCPECGCRVSLPYLSNPFEKYSPTVTWKNITISTTTGDNNED